MQCQCWYRVSHLKQLPHGARSLFQCYYYKLRHNFPCFSYPEFQKITFTPYRYLNLPLQLSSLFSIPRYVFQPHSTLNFKVVQNATNHNKFCASKRSRQFGREDIRGVYNSTSMLLCGFVGQELTKILFSGGQLLRTAAGLSSLLEQPIEIHDVRGNREGKKGKKGGLRAQHIACLTTLAKWSCSNTGHLRNESTQVSFLPRKRKASQVSYRYWTERDVPGNPSPKRTATIEIGGVGSIMLLLQAVLPYILYNGPKSGEDPTPLHLTVMGGTHVSKAPTLDYFSQVFVPTLKNLGYPEITVREIKRGWGTGPTIPGEIEVVIPSIPAGTTIPGFTMQEAGEIVGYDVTFIVPEDARRSFRETLNIWFEDRAQGVDMNIVKDEDSGHGTRFYLLMVAKTRNGYRIARDWIWDRKKRDVHQVAHDMTRKVWGWVQEEIEHGGCVDHYLQDQLVIYQVLAEGQSLVDGGALGEGSLHTQTVRWVGSEVADVKWETVLEMGEDDDESRARAMYRCTGVGLVSSTGEGWD
ncbi:hypothetical protein TWF970_007895 [Orbilia oligospora]|uniref:RNA 3'-terminal phosphate cyclase domain-containing protein n=1 Tax=Orbilia oligospora TaxID=2813651 RepID=A0A7C8V2R5_ORBOL|nr:hypothetical protein TWF970_007895 [Orbilia oligospora]